MTFALLQSLLLTFVPVDVEAAIALRQEGALDNAIASFQEVLRRDPGSEKAKLELGHALALAGRYREALATYEELQGSDEPLWQWESAKWRSRTFLYLGEIGQALEANRRERALARQRGDAVAESVAAWYRGHILTELGDYGRATGAFVEALGIATGELDTLHLAGVMAARQGDAGSLRYQIEDLKQAVRASGDPAQERRVFHLEAELALLQNRPKEALLRAEKANALVAHPLYQDAIARAWAAQGEWRRAESTYREIVGSYDERLDIPLYYVRALAGLATALDEQGRKDEARTYYKTFLDHWGEESDLPGVSKARARLQGLPAAP